MNSEVTDILNQYFNKESDLFFQEKNFIDDETPTTEKLKKYLLEITANITPQHQQRVYDELYNWGPLTRIDQDPFVSEILVNSQCDIFYEKNGQFIQHSDCFFDQKSYHRFIERLSVQCQSSLSKENPYIETEYNQRRISIIFKDNASGEYILSIRKQISKQWTLKELHNQEWCNTAELDFLKKIIKEKKNFLVVGNTGVGKTAVLQALLNETSNNERTITLEDTKELLPPNKLSVSLVTSQSVLNPENSVSLKDLLKRSLRLRPDRIVVGEIRGEEATQLLLTLATGHEGSFGSLHSRNCEEALLRLEMLVQMGAPQWSIQSIRNLIGSTVNYILILEKTNGKRRLKSIYHLVSVEQHGIITDRIELN